MIVLGQVNAVRVAGARRITTSCNLVQVGGVAVGTGHVQAVGVHVHIKRLVGLVQRGVQVTVFDRIAATFIDAFIKRAEQVYG